MSRKHRHRLTIPGNNSVQHWGLREYHLYLVEVSEAIQPKIPAHTSNLNQYAFCYLDKKLASHLITPSPSCHKISRFMRTPSPYREDVLCVRSRIKIFGLKQRTIARPFFVWTLNFRRLVLKFFHFFNLTPRLYGAALLRFHSLCQTNKNENETLPHPPGQKVSPVVSLDIFGNFFLGDFSSSIGVLSLGRFSPRNLSICFTRLTDFFNSQFRIGCKK